MRPQPASNGPTTISPRPSVAVPSAFVMIGDEAGIFAVGDIRSESVKKVASGVGEGSVWIGAVHRCLAAAYDAAP